MKISIIGAGQMAQSITADLLLNCEKLSSLHVIEQDLSRLEKFTQLFRDARIKPVHASLYDYRKHINPEVRDAVKGSEVTVGATSYRHNYDLTKLCIEVGSHFCDLGGNNSVVTQQHLLHSQCEDAGISVLPDCGLAPGLINIAGAYYAALHNPVETLQLYVGGLPLFPDNEMRYECAFSIEGLINEYDEECELRINHKRAFAQPITGVEQISLNGFSDLEAFHTSGGISTMTKTMIQIPNLSYKTLRYRGHHRYIQAMRDGGSFRPSQRERTIHILTEKLAPKSQDVVLIRVVADGHKHDCIVNAQNGFTAMQRATGIPTAIIVGMLAEGLLPNGVCHQEVQVPQPRFIAELERRNIVFS